MRLAGKVAIITGGAQGIGRQTALTFAREGARVMIGDVKDGGGETTVREIVAAGGAAACRVCDVTSFEAIGALVEAAVATFGRLDILVNNAYHNIRGTVLDISPEDWAKSRATMLDATYYGCKAAIPRMIASGGGSIISLSSVHGYLAARNSAVYEASKAALINLMREVACDFGPQGIRANCICPGLIVTEVTNPRYEADPAAARFAAEIYPVRRYGRPDDIANAALFLASDESTFVTGHALVVDGGMTAQLQDDLAQRIAEYVRKS
jgi:NAD(P)-dependent dehydrogenase (short-subunit alcohol dehydrogenase family)